MLEITARQKEVLSFICQYYRENTYPPTVRELCNHFNISIRAVQEHLQALQRKGYISQTKNQARSTRILKTCEGEDISTKTCRIPYYCFNSSDKISLDEGSASDYITLAEPFVQEGSQFMALRVFSESMIGAKIFEGDTAVFKKTNETDNGNIVLAMYDNSILLRRYFKDGPRIRLLSENPSFKPIYTQKNVEILGVLSSVFRTF